MNPTNQRTTKATHATQPRPAPDALWVIVLAGGDGKRLLPLTTALHGSPVPKQFATLKGDHSMLQNTLLRARAVAPWEKIVVVATRPFADLARQQTQALGPVTVLEQPANIGTAPGLLLGLAHIATRDPNPRILLMPSDHHVERPRVFEETLEDLVSAKDLEPGIVLLGIQPDRPEPEYGWILPGRLVAMRPLLLRKVVRFVEKPPPTTASELLRHNALWNSMVLTATGKALWALAERRLPDLARRFSQLRDETGSASEQRKLERLYADLPPADLSRAVLTHASQDLVVATAPACGWSDWGTPQRVFESLAGTRALEQLQRRLRGTTLPLETPSWSM